MHKKASQLARLSYYVVVYPTHALELLNLYFTPPMVLVVFDTILPVEGFS